MDYATQLVVVSLHMRMFDMSIPTLVSFNKIRIPIKQSYVQLLINLAHESSHIPNASVGLVPRPPFNPQRGKEDLMTTFSDTI